MSVKILVNPTAHEALDNLFARAPKTAEEAAKAKGFQPIPAGMTRRVFEERSKKAAGMRYHLGVRRSRK